jgi:hypothetical protein
MIYLENPLLPTLQFIIIIFTLRNINLQPTKFLINKMHQLPFSSQCTQNEINTVIKIGQNNGYPSNIISDLNLKIKILILQVLITMNLTSQNVDYFQLP